MTWGALGEVGLSTDPKFYTDSANLNSSIPRMTVRGPPSFYKMSSRRSSVSASVASGGAASAGTVSVVGTEPEGLPEQMRKQVEYYFSNENLRTDRSPMDGRPPCLFDFG